jgi:hypothetical protein
MAVRETTVEPSAEAWSGSARSLLEAAIRRHGGWEAWSSLQTLAVRPLLLQGMLPWLKGFGRTFRLPPRAQIHPHQERAVFFDFPAPGATGTFERGRLTLTDASGAVTFAADDGRDGFRGWRKLRRWSAAGALYFFGYALTHYHGLPFTLGRGRPGQPFRLRHEGRWLNGIQVELPPELHTHSRRQTFYFDDDGLLRRHDYVADIAGAWARGAHLWRDFVTVAGLQMPSTRHVIARIGRWTTPFVALHAELQIEQEPSPGGDALVSGPARTGGPRPP